MQTPNVTKDYGPWGSSHTLRNRIETLLSAGGAWLDTSLNDGGVLWISIWNGTTREAKGEVNVTADTTVRERLESVLTANPPVLAQSIPAGRTVRLQGYVYQADPVLYVCPTEGTAHFSRETPGFCPEDGQALVSG